MANDTFLSLLPREVFIPLTYLPASTFTGTSYFWKDERCGGERREVKKLHVTPEVVPGSLFSPLAPCDRENLSREAQR